MTTLSAIIICKNEEHNIRDCLESIKFADEIIVLDSNSTDKTVDIAKAYTDKIFITSDWPGYGPQKNRALAKASSQWVLSIDADERVTDQLRQTIVDVISNKRTYDAFKIKRLSSYCGRMIYHGDWSNDYVVRLFRRLSGQFTKDIVHERFILNQEKLLGTLTQPLLHYSFKSLNQVLKKMNHYSSAGAIKNCQQAKKSSITKAIFHSIWSFIRGYFLRLGFLDGREGFLLAISNAEGVFYRYVKMLYD